MDDKYPTDNLIPNMNYDTNNSNFSRKQVSKQAVA